MSPSDSEDASISPGTPQGAGTSSSSLQSSSTASQTSLFSISLMMGSERAASTDSVRKSRYPQSFTSTAKEKRETSVPWQTSAGPSSSSSARRPRSSSSSRTARGTQSRFPGYTKSKKWIWASRSLQWSPARCSSRSQSSLSP